MKSNEETEEYERMNKDVYKIEVHGFIVYKNNTTLF